MKKIGILGSTGSIGTQSLDIIEKNPELFKVTALTCGRQTDRLEEQIRKFKPSVVCVENEKDALLVQKKHPKLEILYGDVGLAEIAEKSDCQLIINALVGIRGLVPTQRAIMAGKDIALANKETLVAGGHIIMDSVYKSGIALLPVDSEHSAIFQALQGNKKDDVNRILLTASGGPFRGYTLEQLKNVTVKQALKHPNWNMGKKITIDSATMMNKGLEVIEARWLFDIDPEKIQVLVHKESIIHSMVLYKDGSIIAQLSVPDMRVPIRYALTYPDRIENEEQTIDFIELKELTFEKVDQNVFRCLGLAYEAIKRGDSYPIVLNAANEVLVQKYLDEEIALLDIQNIIERVLEKHVPVNNPELEDILAIDLETRRYLERWD